MVGNASSSSSRSCGHGVAAASYQPQSTHSCAVDPRARVLGRAREEEVRVEADRDLRGRDPAAE